MIYLWMVLLGLGAGILSGTFGIGGGIVIVPILLTIFHMHYHSAVGTSLVALLLPVGILGVWQYYKSGKIGSYEINLGLFIALGLFIGSFLGSSFATSLSGAYLKKGFALVLCAAAVKTWFS